MVNLVLDIFRPRERMKRISAWLAPLSRVPLGIEQNRLTLAGCAHVCREFFFGVCMCFGVFFFVARSEGKNRNRKNAPSSSARSSKVCMFNDSHRELGQAARTDAGDAG